MAVRNERPGPPISGHLLTNNAALFTAWSGSPGDSWSLDDGFVFLFHEIETVLFFNLSRQRSPGSPQSAGPHWEHSMEPLPREWSEKRDPEPLDTIYLLVYQELTKYNLDNKDKSYRMWGVSRPFPCTPPVSNKHVVLTSRDINRNSYVWQKDLWISKIVSKWHYYVLQLWAH